MLNRADYRDVQCRANSINLGIHEHQIANKVCRLLAFMIKILDVVQGGLTSMKREEGRGGAMIIL